VVKSKVLVPSVFVCLFASSGLGGPNTQIWYERTNVDSGRRQDAYQIINVGLDRGGSRHVSLVLSVWANFRRVKKIVL